MKSKIITANKDRGTSVGFTDDHFLNFTKKDWDDLQETYEENKLMDAKYSENEMQEAVKLIERAYALNKDDFGFDIDATEFINKYKK